MVNVTKYKNKAGTKNRRPRDGRTFTEQHNKHTRRKIDECQALRCTRTDIVGAHVIKANSNDKKEHLVMLCRKHNNMRQGQEFRLKKHAPKVKVSP